MQARLGLKTQAMEGRQQIGGENRFPIDRCEMGARAELLVAD
jgi:hypothetical protein